MEDYILTLSNMGHLRFSKVETVHLLPVYCLLPDWLRYTSVSRKLCWLHGKGFMGTPYVQTLSSELQNINWSLCQLHMRSSYMGFGTGSLARDFEDISSAIGYLLKNGKHQVVLMGHSTGCQNSIHYILNHSNTENSPSVSGVIVCDPLIPALIVTSSKLLWAIESP